MSKQSDAILLNPYGINLTDLIEQATNITFLTEHFREFRRNPPMADRFYIYRDVKPSKIKNPIGIPYCLPNSTIPTGHTIF